MSASLCRLEPAAGPATPGVAGIRPGSFSDRRVGAAVVAVPAGLLVSGTIATAVDFRFELLAAAAVLGWTKLVGT